MTLPLRPFTLCGLFRRGVRGATLQPSTVLLMAGRMLTLFVSRGNLETAARLVNRLILRSCIGSTWRRLQFRIVKLRAFVEFKTGNTTGNITGTTTGNTTGNTTGIIRPTAPPYLRTTLRGWSSGNDSTIEPSRIFQTL